MNRLVEPELLDELPSGDPRALRSRRDLRRVSAWMQNHKTMAAALVKTRNSSAFSHVTDLGAGDGNFLLRVAQLIRNGAPASGPVCSENAGRREVKATLLDRQKIVSRKTLESFFRLGWRAEAMAMDVFDWPQTGNSTEVVVANLFLHHFEEARLAELLRKISRHAKLFVAVEPRRAVWPLFCSRRLWAIGCSAVTRHDAVASVRAGFSANELSALWPDGTNWLLTERSAGPFSHLFIAQRRLKAEPAGRASSRALTP